jgi:hypothetical protein
MAQNKDTQKVDSSNRCHAMIHHQNADAIVLDVCHFEYYQGDECLSNVHWQCMTYSVTMAPSWLVFVWYVAFHVL